MSFLLETERLSLRLRDERDASWNLELLAEHESGTTRTVDQERQRLAEQNTQSRESGIGFLTITRRADGDPIGYCGLLVGRTSFDEPEIAYELLPHARGHGYATEAGRAVLAAAFATGRRRIWATVGAWNTPSFRVLEKLGFRHDHSVIDERGEVVYMVRDVGFGEED